MSDRFDDWLFRIMIALVIAVGVVGIVAILFCRPAPFRYVGLPPGATCGYADDGIETCVGGGAVYTCALSYRSRTAQCALTPRAP